MRATVVLKNRWLLYFGMLAPIVRQVVINITAILSPGYSSVSDFLSEMGAQGAPFAHIFNFFGLILIGLFTLFGAKGLSSQLHQVAGGQLISWLYTCSGIGFVLVGFFPCTPGCIPDPDNLQMKIHMLAGTLGLGTQIWAPLAFGLMGLSNRLFSSERLLGLILGLVGVVSYVFLIFHYQELAYAGLLQRLVQGCADLWLLIISFSAFINQKDTI